MNNAIKKIVKKHLMEALGVPNNIMFVANDLYDEIINELKNYTSINDLKIINIKKEFNISDIKFTSANFEFRFESFDEYDVPENINIDLASAGAIFHTTRSDLKLKYVKKNSIDIVFYFIIKPEIDINGLIDFFVERKENIVTTISHELKHVYDNTKKGTRDLKSRVEYDIFSEGGIHIKPIREFFYNVYFIHDVENLVRPTEIATKLHLNNVTKKEFYNFITTNRIFEKLKEIQNFSVDEFINKLKEPKNLEEIKKLFEKNNIEYETLNDDEIVDQMLKLTYVNIINWMGIKMRDRLLGNDFVKRFFGLNPEESKYFQSFISKIRRFDKEHKKYFEYQEKHFKFVTTKVIKKISKLYSMAKDVQNESITNPDIWYVYFTKEKLLSTKFELEIRN